MRQGNAGLHAYLGPEGTFSEAALRAIVADAAHRVSKPSITAALDAVRQRAVIDATVPWENSMAGTVAETIRGLAADESVIVRREVVLPVNLVLAALPGTAQQGVVKIFSHPHALAQAEPWISEVVPAATRVSARSTAQAADAVSQRRYGPGYAALCSEAAAGMYGLAVIARPPADAALATTRFIIVGLRQMPASPLTLPRGAADEPMTTTLLLHLPGDWGHEDAEAALKGASLRRHRIVRNVTELPGGRRCMLVHVSGGHPEWAFCPNRAELRWHGVGIRYLGSYATVSPAEVPVGSPKQKTDLGSHDIARPAYD